MIIAWPFERKWMLPILEFSGIANTLDAEELLIEEALEIIDDAIEFTGIPCPLYNNNNFDDIETKNAIRIKFSLIFFNENLLKEFCELFQ